MSDQGTHVLVVDDERAIGELVRRWLDAEGYSCEVAHDGAQALEAIEKYSYELLILDINLPDLSGIEILERAKESTPETAVIMMTGAGDADAGRRSMELGAHGYLVKPLDQTAMTVNVAGALESRVKTLEIKDHQKELEEEVRQRTEEIRHREEEIALRLVAAAEYRDDETRGHIRRVGMYSEALARALGLNIDEAEDIRVAAPMHDIGKIGIPDGILLKRGELSAPEFEVVKLHTEIGAAMLSGTEIPILQVASQIALNHHEKWDGSGYPGGLVGRSIPKVARIVAVADVYDSLSCDRPYRPAMTTKQAAEILQEGRGTHFDPEILDAFMDLLPVVRSIAQRFSDEAAAAAESSIGL